MLDPQLVGPDAAGSYGSSASGFTPEHRHADERLVTVHSRILPAALIVVALAVPSVAGATGVATRADGATVTARRTAPPLTVGGAKTVYTQSRRGFVGYELEETGRGWDDTCIGAAVCRRVTRSVVDCGSTISFYVTNVDDPTMYDEGQECSFRLRVRRFSNGQLGVYNPLLRDAPGDYGGVPCKTV
jgi:hypothetical protein